MTANTKRVSIYSPTSTGPDSRNDEPKEDLWGAMLGSVASGKRLPQKNLIVLGGSPASQRDFVSDLTKNDPRRGLDSQLPPVANDFALGYTYYDLLDVDHEDTLARISLYLLSTPSSSFASLLAPLLTPQSIPNTFIVILLDWAEPHSWLRKLRQWILLLRRVFQSLDVEQKEVMEETMASWRNRGRDGSFVNLDGTVTNSGGEGGGGTGGGGGGGNNGGSNRTSNSHDEGVQPGPGEWEDALGLPLCVVCQNAQRMDRLEKDQGWREPDFDQVLQYLRTVLLRHGASLIYTTANIPSPLPTLIHASLGITSLLKRQPLKHNVIDRDKVLVPPNWDSWGKIRVLREGFEVEAASAMWSDDIHVDDPILEHDADGQISPLPSSPTDDGFGDHGSGPQTPSRGGGPRKPVSAISTYESRLPERTTDTLVLAGQEPADSSKLETTSEDTQEFLDKQLRLLEAYRAKAAKLDAAKAASTASGAGGRKGDDMDGVSALDSGVSHHIGPVQFNMGGIQVDADDMLQRLKDRQYGSSEPPSPTPEPVRPAAPVVSTSTYDTEQLQSFFSGLMKNRGQTGSSS